MAVRLDWIGLMRAGLHELRLSPAAFWALSPFELQVMLGHVTASPQMSRAWLEGLTAAYPDTPETGADHHKGNPANGHA